MADRVRAAAAAVAVAGARLEGTAGPEDKVPGVTVVAEEVKEAASDEERRDTFGLEKDRWRPLGSKSGQILR